LFEEYSIPLVSRADGVRAAKEFQYNGK